MKWRPVALLALLFVTPAGCGDDETTGPSDEPPTVTILSAPFSAGVGETVEVLYRATDDSGLDQISVSWGTFDAPVEIVFPSGAVFEDVASYQYQEPASYLITITAIDTNGERGRAQVEVTVEP